MHRNGLWRACAVSGTDWDALAREAKTLADPESDAATKAWLKGVGPRNMSDWLGAILKDQKKRPRLVVEIGAGFADAS